MSDPRLTPANGHVASRELQGIIAADEYVTGAARQVSVPVADLLRAPAGPRDRQLLMGEAVRVLEERDGWAFLQARKDGYCGYVHHSQLCDLQEVTHWVNAPSTHLYEEPNFKSRDLMPLSFGSKLTVLEMHARFAQTPFGFVPRQHIVELGEVERSPAQVARLFLGTPYLWGGNSRFGIDCSGLVQAALTACGIDCAGDSDLQEKSLGRDATGNPKAGDLLFWKGHVAMLADNKTLIHANAHAMSVVLEGLDVACARIAEQGDGEVTRHARL
ncbi:NlpC/P60 family protein [Planktotalea sp.]|uniref:C40 family peptidase n=1 Tax=Planktotalea sp. TaxID=2029877 RepID=UPI003297D6F7